MFIIRSLFVWVWVSRHFRLQTSGRVILPFLLASLSFSIKWCLSPEFSKVTWCPGMSSRFDFFLQWITISKCSQNKSFSSLSCLCPVCFVTASEGYLELKFGLDGTFSMKCSLMVPCSCGMKNPLCSVMTLTKMWKCEHWWMSASRLNLYPANQRILGFLV